MSTPPRYDRQVDLFIEIHDIEPLRDVAHRVAGEVLGQVGGVRPNEFVSNDQQAADYAAQDDQMVVSLVLAWAIKTGLEAIAPNVQVLDSYGRALPDGYRPPGY